MIDYYAVLAVLFPSSRSVLAHVSKLKDAEAVRLGALGG